MNRPSLTARMALTTGLSVMVLIGCAFFYVHTSLGRLYRKETAAKLQKVALQTARCVLCQEGEQHSAPLPATRSLQVLTDITAQLENRERVLVRVTDPQGRMQFETSGFGRLLPQNLLPVPGDWVWHEMDGPTGAHFLIFATRYRDGWVLAAWDLSHEYLMLQTYRNLLLWTWAITGLGTGGVVVLMTRLGLRSVDRLAAHAESIHPGSLGKRLDPATLPPEFRVVAERLNEALGRLEDAFSRHQALSADMAHELRTPLHGMRMKMEELLREPHPPEALHALLASLEHLSMTLDQMLFLARAEDPALVLQRVPLELHALAEAATAPFASLAEDKAVHLGIQIPEGLALLGEETLLRRALHNLLSNALRYAPSGTCVILRAWEGPNSVVLEVEDQGPGFPEAFKARIGERFLRPDKSRARATGGAGLGLAIVHRILHLHGAHLEIRDGEGCGTVMRLVFRTMP